MSLKSFHIVFIVCSILLSLFFGYWAVQQYQQNGTSGYLWTAIASFLSAALLITYEILFLKKVKA